MVFIEKQINFIGFNEKIFLEKFPQKHLDKKSILGYLFGPFWPSLKFNDTQHFSLKAFFEYITLYIDRVNVLAEQKNYDFIEININNNIVTHAKF